MTKIDALFNTLQKIYFILHHYHLKNAAGEPEPDDQQLNRQQVKEYLGISESTYKRKVREGALHPMKLPGGDNFIKAYWQMSTRKV
ncbi:DNA-binding protein [Pedobacter petrophilus]|uniref:DNA-binding protein n=1 Tax=Pedobacter petrophilus TaxID=1908241 RepID=A0A7K0FSY0_9SPHI|nr:DNA-binding protein [Pedobacter petrophilus]MRX74715.1 DNA-binding protein [Pedobacter petrophilus]